MTTLLSPEERMCYRFTHQTPGLSQKAIAKKLGVNQGQISRWLDSATAKINALKQLCRDAGGDSDVVEVHLARLPDHVQTDTLAHTQ